MTTRECLPLSTHSEDGAKIRDGCSREIAKMGHLGVTEFAMGRGDKSDRSMLASFLIPVIFTRPRTTNNLPIGSDFDIFRRSLVTQA